MLRPTNRRLVILTFAIAFCTVGLTQAGDRIEIAPDRTDHDDRAVQRAFADAQDTPISIHRLLRDRVDRMLRIARALQSDLDADDDPIRGNGLSDGPDPTDSRAQSEYSEDGESKSDGDRSDEYQDAIDETSAGDQQTQELTIG